MNEKRLGVLMGILCIVLIVLNGFLYMAKHSGRPSISFSGKAPTYTKGIKNKELLTNVKAKDGKDGDLTDKVFVANVSVRKSGAYVTYMVKDSDNHVVSEVQTLKVSDKGSSDEQTEEEKKAAEEKAAAEKKAAEEAAAAEQKAAEEAAAAENTNPEAPVIKLNTDAVTLKKGEKFNYSQYIESISDNKDGQDKLGKSIQVKGADTSSTGEKEVIYYIVDSDGNKSAEAKIKLIVQ